MYEKIMTLCGILGIIFGIPAFLRSRRAAKSSESKVAEFTELRKSGTNIIPVVKYEKNGREYTAVHFRPMKSFEIKYAVGDKTVVNVVSGPINEFYFTDEENLYSTQGLQFILGGGVCLIIGIILYSVLS